jgi:hypothetical protein
LKKNSIGEPTGSVVASVRPCAGFSMKRRELFSGAPDDPADGVGDAPIEQEGGGWACSSRTCYSWPGRTGRPTPRPGRLQVR